MTLALDRHSDLRTRLHLAEVAALSATALAEPEREVGLAVAWLHDIHDDEDVEYEEIARHCGTAVAEGVRWLSDREDTGPRAVRKRLRRERLVRAPSSIQTIAVADIVSNVPSMMRYRPDFAIETYVPEKRLLLDVLTRAHPGLVSVAWSYIHQAEMGASSSVKMQPR